MSTIDSETFYAAIETAQDPTADAGHLREAIATLYPFLRRYSDAPGAIRCGVFRIARLTGMSHQRIRLDALRDARHRAASLSH
jgi:hypothetical protein